MSDTMNNWLALHTAIVWYCEITSEQAIAQVEGIITLSPMRRLKDISIDVVKRLHDTILNPQFCKPERLEKRYRLDRYTIATLVDIFVRNGGHQMSEAVEKEIIEIIKSGKFRARI